MFLSGYIYYKYVCMSISLARSVAKRFVVDFNIYKVSFDSININYVQSYFRNSKNNKKFKTIFK